MSSTKPTPTNAKKELGYVRTQQTTNTSSHRVLRSRSMGEGSSSEPQRTVSSEPQRTVSQRLALQGEALLHRTYQEQRELQEDRTRARVHQLVTTPPRQTPGRGQYEKRESQEGITSSRIPSTRHLFATSSSNHTVICKVSKLFEMLVCS